MKYRDYVIKRLLLLFPVVFGVSLLTFAISISVADPVLAYLGQNATKIPADTRAKIAHRLGFDQPWWVQYLKYMERLLNGDWGFSTSSKGPVLPLLASHFPATVELALTAVVIGVSIGIPLGIISAIRQDKAADHVSRIFALTGVSIPVFWFGLMLQVFLYTLNASFPFLPILPRQFRITSPPYSAPTTILFGTLPATGLLLVDTLLSGQFSMFVDVFMHLIPPGITLSLGLMAILSRMTRMSMVEVLRQDYILLAKSKGLRERVIIYKHAFRNALLPTLTVAGIALAGLLTGAVLTEDVFAWPGIGQIAGKALINLDIGSLQGVVILTAVLYVISNLAIDLLYGFIDPRIRYD